VAPRSTAPVVTIHPTKIRAIITLTSDHALARAKAADVEIASGKYRSPLHGIPYGVKDLLDTKDILTQAFPANSISMLRHQSLV
jgi:Asp-tRNA(Asn)/Glu-tRNA(Gln) amidotransferase A subunit family amidase